jgi:Cdc6-like AAA superfamily ATPase
LGDYVTIADVTDNDLKRVLAENLTPSDTIKTPERLFGREKYLTTIDRALSSPGRQIFIYGDRGVGKTSLALTAAYIHSASDSPPIHVMCGKTSGFAEVIQAIGNATIPVEKRIDKQTSGGGFNFNLPGGAGGIGVTRGTKSTSITAPQSLNEALDVVRYIAAKRSGKTIIVIDEMERIETQAERDKFAEFIKNIPEIDADVRFIFCDIAHDLTELLQSHPSAGRILETIPLDRLKPSDLWQILNAVANRLSVEIQFETLIRIGQVSDGFPHYVHLIGESLFWSMFDDPSPVTRSGAAHFKAGIEGALRRTEASLRAQYDKATQKYRNTSDYQEALWALADSTSDRRQIADIYDSSYKWIIAKREGRSLMPRDKLNQRYLSLRKDTHGRIVAGYGAGWFSFRENILVATTTRRVWAKCADNGCGKHSCSASLKAL